MRTVGKVRGFTLVELLVVIGIIALLISILLPALSKARDQANMVACQSNMHQLSALEALYEADYKGAMIPAVFQEFNAEFDFYGAELLGHELGPTVGKYAQGTTIPNGRVIGEALVIKNCLTCPAAEHSLDPNTDNLAASGLSTTDYWGDYLINVCMGQIKYVGAVPNDPTQVQVYYPFQKVGQVPNNVIVFMESRKPNCPLTSFVMPDGTTGPTSSYKPYFQKYADLFYPPTPITGIPTSKLTLMRIGTPHSKRKKMNVMFADGHVALVDPLHDFFQPTPTTLGWPQEQTNKNYMWDSGYASPYVTATPVLSNVNWKRGLPGIN